MYICGATQFLYAFLHLISKGKSYASTTVMITAHGHSHGGHGHSHGGHSHNTHSHKDRSHVNNNIPETEPLESRYMTSKRKFCIDRSITELKKCRKNLLCRHLIYRVIQLIGTLIIAILISITMQSYIFNLNESCNISLFTNQFPSKTSNDTMALTSP